MLGVAEVPRRRRLAGAQQFRIVPSRFPPIPLFETLVDADELEVLYALESMTNDRVQAEAGNIFLVSREERVTGPGGSVVMAAFTHIGRTSRFSDGSYGVYYAGLDEDTAIAETVFHTERRLRQTREPPIEIEMRCYVGDVSAAMDDITGPKFVEFQDGDLKTWPTCQRFAAARRAADSNGLYYLSAREAGGRCIAAFRPKAVTLPVQGKHFRYCWNGERIDAVLTVSAIRSI